MHVLFVHQNFPAQFRYLAPRLATDHGWTCSFITANAAAEPLPGVRRITYRPSGGATAANHICTRGFENAVGHATGVYEALKARPDVRPDLVVAHSGFGSSLFLPFLYDAPVINFFELFYRPVGQDLGYRPEQRVTEPLLMRSKARNAMILLDLDNCDRGWCPSFYQRDTLPPEFHPKVDVIPEGVDTSIYRRIEGTRRRDRHVGNGRRVGPDTRVITYVSRGFEKMRGFDVFMRAAKRIYQQFPDVLFVVVGSDGVYYGNESHEAREGSFREKVLRSDDYDLARFHFTGTVPEATLAEILAASDLHIYLTAPFVTSWSMLDAMGCGCVVLASDQACVREYITHGRNGLLCDFFDAEGIARQAVEVLRDPEDYRVLGTAAGLTIDEEYSLDVTLPRIKAFFESTAAGQRRPSVRAERLLKPADMPAPAATAQKIAESAPVRHSTERAEDPTPRAREDFDGALPWWPGRGQTAPPRKQPLWAEPSGRVRVDASVFAGARPADAARARTVLFAWELGGGLGHVMQMLPLAKALVERGHRVFVALNDLATAEAGFAGTGVCYLQAPSRSEWPSTAKRPFPKTLTFTHVLANVGWDEERVLFAIAAAWRNIFRMVRPDLIVFDHSPTALLAARGLPARKALIGSGFCAPPNVSPWPLFRPELEDRVDPMRVAEDERQVLGRAGVVLERLGQRPLDCLGRLYGDVDENFLTTFPELDHFPCRAAVGAPYWGPVLGPTGGKAPRWPDGRGRRVFAYLKNFQCLPHLLQRLRERGNPTLVYVTPRDELVRSGLESETLRFVDDRLDLPMVAHECDAAVLNGGHGATAEMLLAGKPLLQVPLALEQKLTARAVERLGAGEHAHADNSALIEFKLDSLLSDLAYDRYRDAAGRFAARYAPFDADRQRQAMLGRTEELLARG